MRALFVGLLLLLASLASAAGEIAWTIAKASPTDVAVHAEIQPGWHLYSSVPLEKSDAPFATSFALEGAGSVSAVTESEPERALDKNFGYEVAFFQKEATFTLATKGYDPARSKLSVTYQLCNDRVCLPPKTVTVASTGSAPGAVSGSAVANVATGNAGDVTGQVSNAQKAGLGAYLALAFGAGLLALLTPCVFPMIPITVSYFSKQKSLADEALEPGARKKPGPVAQALAFCLGIIGTYTVFGIGLALIFGASSVQRFATNPWVNLALAALFIYLALNLFGAVQISVPASLTNRFSPEGKGGLVAPVLMGFTFTLTSFTCAVGYVGVLFAAAASGSVLYPVLGMLAFSTAFALPFFLLALFPAFLARLPKSGSWMETVKATMGFVELMAALKFLSNADLVTNPNPILPRATFLAIWAAIALLAALWLFGAVRLPSVYDAKIGWLRRGFGLAFTAMAALFFLAVPGKGLGTVDSFLPPGQATGNGSYDMALRDAREQGKPLLINFTGVTCTNCRFMEQNVFPNPKVKPELEKYVVAELYTDRLTSKGDKINRDLQLKLTGSEALPLYVVVSPEGKVVRKFEGSTNDPSVFAKFLAGS